MNWLSANGKYCSGDWRVYPTPDGWRISKRVHPQLPHFEEVTGECFSNSREAIATAERMAEYDRDSKRTNAALCAR